VILTVQEVWREGDEVVATVVDGAAREERRFTGRDAVIVASEWERARFDISLYAALPPGFPAPTGIPVELPSARVA